MERFIELHAKPNTIKWKDTRSLHVHTLVKEWGSRDPAGITRSDIHEVLDRIAAEEKISKARERRKHLSALPNWSVDRGVLPVNPMAGMRRPDLKYKQRDRGRSLEEIAAIWHTAATVGYPFGPIVQLLILTAQRRSEIGNLQRPQLSECWQQTGFWP